MVSVIKPSICLVFLSLLELGYSEKKSSHTDKIILHVPYKIIHHHHTPDIVPISQGKLKKKPEEPKEVIIEESKPEPVKHEESPKKERKIRKQKRLKSKRKQKLSSSTAVPLESFLGIDQIFKDTNIPAQSIPVRAKHPRKITKPRDYQFSDGTNYYDARAKHSPQSTSYMFTSMDHSQPIPRHVATGRSQDDYINEQDYEHVGYIVFGDRIQE